MLKHRDNITLGRVRRADEHAGDPTRAHHLVGSHPALTAARTRSCAVHVPGPAAGARSCRRRRGPPPPGTQRRRLPLLCTAV
jgi:hypothetical protein